MGREAREVWEKRVGRWRESGLSAREFAAEVGINAHTLSYWAWRLGRPEPKPHTSGPRRRRERSPAPTAASSTPVEFLELVAGSADAVMSTIPPTPLASAPPAIELVLTTGRTLRVPPGFDAESLRRLLALLEAA